MSDTRCYQLLNDDDIIPQLRHRFPKDQLQLPQRSRNSAPSRLQHLNGYSADDISIASRFSGKSNSLTNLFPRTFFPCGDALTDRSCSNGCIVGFASTMQAPSNSPESLRVSTPPSTFDPVELRTAFLPSSCPDPNNNDDILDDCDTISQTSSTSLEGSDERAQCYGIHAPNSKRTRSLVADRVSDDWKRLIRQDTFNFNKLRLNDKATNGESNQSFGESDSPSSLGEAVGGKSAEVDCAPEKDEDSVSSFSSDDTFVCDDIMEDKPALVYRSMSDSTMHRSCRREITEKHKRRKSVHFADTSGYELEIHIPIRQSDELQVPPRLLEALDKIRAESEKKSCHKMLSHDKGGFNTLLTHFSLVLNFQQPFLEPTFQCRITQQNICLESVSVLPHSLSFTGVIRVVNLEFEKQVLVRFTTNSWKTHCDIPARYVASLLEFHQDQFSFHIVAPDTITGSGKLEMALCYSVPKSKREFWDNNYGRNYVIKCLQHRGNHCDDGMMT